MEWNSSSPDHGEPSVVQAGEADWRDSLRPESRKLIVNKIMETLRRRLPVTIPEGLNELKKIAVRLEDTIYSSATSQSDYLRKISLKMLSMEGNNFAANNHANGSVNQDSSVSDPGEVIDG